MLMSDEIARIIEDILIGKQGEAEIKRNELASRIGCVPSQINYVITSRFTPARGYIVESKRGGGGYIRIRKIEMDRNEYLAGVHSSIGDKLSSADMRDILYDLYNKGIIDGREVNTLSHLLSDSSFVRLPRDLAESVRADMFRAAILNIIKNHR